MARKRYLAITFQIGTRRKVGWWARNTPNKPGDTKPSKNPRVEGKMTWYTNGILDCATYYKLRQARKSI
jgi:hypothetical protein